MRSTRISFLSAVSFWVGFSHAGVSDDLSFLKVRLAGKSTTVQVMGRILPKLGALQVERSDVQGQVLSILCKEGDRVKPGSPLIRVASHRCPLAAAECTQVAIHDGVVSEILKSKGQELEVGEGIVNILNPEGVLIRLDVPSKYMKYISVGQPVKVSMASSSGKSFETRVCEILPPVGTGDTTRALRLTSFTPPPGVRLDSLVNAEISVPIAGEGLKVPAKAVAFSGGKHYVIKRAKDELEPIPVKVTGETGGFLWVHPEPEGHLSDGDSILAERAIFVLPGLLQRKVR